MYRHATRLLGLFFSMAVGSALCVAESPPKPVRRQVLQMVHEYFTLSENVIEPEHGEHILNGFLNYTHLGTDFGFLGPGELHCTCMPGSICGDLPKVPDGWAGVWHSLNSLAREHEPLNLRACYPSIISAEFQPRVVGIQCVVMGFGKFKLELKSDTVDRKGQPTEALEWAKTFSLVGAADTHTLKTPVDSKTIPYAQYLNWVAEPGSSICVDSIGLNIELPPVDFPTYVFLASYAKFARCFSEQTGLVSDRAHTLSEAFSNVPATGMFALATVAAQRLGIVDEARARSTVRHIMATLRTLPSESGLLPHFVYLRDGKWAVLPGSEYSTVDTALCLIPLRIAADCLHDEETAALALEMLHAIRINSLRDANGYVIHGLHENRTPLTGVWKDWGGETAMVLMMQRIAAGPTLLPKMDENGRTFRGVGFIPDMPGLFFSKFNTSAVAQAGCVDWQAYRQERLAQQKSYFPTNAPKSVAAKLGLYGLSAGEGSRGRGYYVSGVEDKDQHLIYPHYILMSALMEKDTQKVYDLLSKMEARGWFPPWGLVENIEADGSVYLPMIGALNASFEALSSYHLLMHQRGQRDELYEAATADPVLNDALAAIFEK